MEGFRGHGAGTGISQAPLGPVLSCSLTEQTPSAAVGRETARGAPRLLPVPSGKAPDGLL